MGRWMLSKHVGGVGGNVGGKKTEISIEFLVLLKRVMIASLRFCKVIGRF